MAGSDIPEPAVSGPMHDAMSAPQMVMGGPGMMGGPMMPGMMGAPMMSGNPAMMQQPMGPGMMSGQPVMGENPEMMYHWPPAPYGQQPGAFAPFAAGGHQPPPSLGMGMPGMMGMPPPMGMPMPGMAPMRTPMAGPMYKTILCSFFQEGKCVHGDGCTYAHGEEELRAPVPGMMPTSAEPGKYKTRLCKHFRRNACLNGDSCPFAHGVTELRGGGGGPSRGRGGRRMDGGRPMGHRGAPGGGEGWPARHPGAFKTRICWHYIRGRCYKGATCSFAHGEEELRAPGPPTNRTPALGVDSPLYKTRLCKHFRDGTCATGDACSFAHGEAELRDPPPPAVGPDGQPVNGPGTAAYKTRLCKHFVAGLCNKGAACSFAHGRDELRTHGVADGSGDELAAEVEALTISEPAAAAAATPEEVPEAAEVIASEEPIAPAE